MPIKNVRPTYNREALHRVLMKSSLCREFSLKSADVKRIAEELSELLVTDNQVIVNCRTHSMDGQNTDSTKLSVAEASSKEAILQRRIDLLNSMDKENLTNEDVKKMIGEMISNAFISGDDALVSKLNDSLDKASNIYNKTKEGQNSRNLVVEVVSYSSLRNGSDGTIQNYKEKSTGEDWLNEAYALLSKLNERDRMKLLVDAEVLSKMDVPTRMYGKTLYSKDIQ